MLMQNGAGISLLVPFRDDGKEGRLINKNWLMRFWESELPDAELIVSDDPGYVGADGVRHLTPFSKTCALNAAFRQSHGDVVVLIDADCYIEPSVIIQCAKRIRTARHPLWFVPYRHLYRLTRVATMRLIESPPSDALSFMEPPAMFDVGSTLGSAAGHWFGALIQIMPREAYQLVGGMDPRFRGWGGEDVTFVRILDTLYATHRTTRNQVFTLWHHQIGDDLLRMWEGQPVTGSNNRLSVEYRKSFRDRERTRRIIEEWHAVEEYQEHLV